MRVFHHLDAWWRLTEGRRERLPRWLSVVVIFALSAVCWAALIGIVMALSLQL
jgi:hypothetical protein